MSEILSSENLQAAITFWLTKKRTWDRDFHNRLYKQLHELKQGGLNETWWARMVGILWDWRAIRPYSRDSIRRSGLPHLSALHHDYRTILEHTVGIKLDLETATWPDLASLYQNAALIKPTNNNSPVFPSKLCHFVLPNAFPVFDWDAVGINVSSYEQYWSDCSALWSSTRNKDELIDTLAAAIRQAYPESSEDPIVPHYPWSTKVTELCLIGSRLTKA